MAFMIPVAEQFTKREAREYTGDSDAKAGWYGRLSAPGYMDCTEWQGPHDSYEAAIKAVMDEFDVDEDGDELSDIIYPDVPHLDAEHDHQWGPLEQSRLTGTVHRKCQVEGCKAVNIYDEDEDEQIDLTVIAAEEAVAYDDDQRAEDEKVYQQELGRQLRKS